MSSTPQPLNPKTAIEKFFQNGKPGLGRFAPCVATSTRNAVFGFSRESRITAPRAGFSVHVLRNVRVLPCAGIFPGNSRNLVKRRPDTMGDKSPKSVNKKAAQKQSKSNASNQKKQQAAASRQAVPAKKK